MADEHETPSVPGEASVQHGPPPFKPAPVAHINLPASHKRFDPHTMQRQVARIHLSAGQHSLDSHAPNRPINRIDKPTGK